MSAEKPAILITGANGFIGSRLCRKFLEQDFRVIAGVRKTSDLSLLKDVGVEYRYGDVTDTGSLPAMVAGVDYIIHNAGVVKAKKRETFFYVNEAGTENLMEAVLAHNPKVKKVLYVSSLAAAGPSVEGRPVHEDDPPHPVTTYGESKLAGEKVMRAYADRLNVVMVRPSGVYGPGDKEMKTLFETAHKRLKPMIGDMDRRLQVVHVDDLCEGIYKAIVSETKSGSIYFICERQAYTMREFIGIFQKASGKKAMPLVIPGGLFKLIAWVAEKSLRLVGVTPMLTREKSGELLASWEVSTSKAEQELGFVSKITLEIGTRETFGWYYKEGWL